jgi:hypothetical protein
MGLSIGKGISEHIGISRYHAVPTYLLMKEKKT